MEFLQNPLFILIVVAIGFAAIGWFLIGVKRTLRQAFGGKIPEDVQIDATRRIRELEMRVENLAPRVELLEEVAAASVRKVGFLRFNPFQDTGGDNSFVVALLDGEDNGVVISSLYMREGTRLYAKQVERGKARHPLSDEEQKVLEEITTR